MHTDVTSLFLKTLGWRQGIVSMKLSIVIPAYNYANYLRQSLPVLLDQIIADDHETELILIDDGSVDDTACVVKALNLIYHGQIQYYYQSNQGPSAARNEGVKKAKGEYIYFLDADDEFQSKALSIFHEFIKAYPKANLFVAGYVDSKSEKPRYLKGFSESCEINFIRFLRKEFKLHQGCYFVRKSVFETLSFPREVVGREDIVFQAQCLASFVPVEIPEVVVKLNRHKTSLRHSKSAHKGMDKIVSALFDKNKLPAAFFQYRKEYESRLYLSSFRDFYLIGDYKKARACYYRAIVLFPRSIFLWSYFKKMLRSFR